MKKSEPNNIKVSVLCLVYNHEPYLKKCLDGFVNQKCDFEYEILIHDDASTDNSASIIKEYEEKYPNIIKPIYQTENQYSKGVKISATYQYPRAKGEYLAWCEGDDYWTDENKLQKQVEFLDNNPDFSACVHCTTMNFIGENKTRKVPNISKSREFLAEEIIKGGGGIFATNSLVMRRKFRENMPKCFLAKGFGDYQIFMYSAMEGGIWCLEDNMSAYNCGTANSWTARVWDIPEKREEHCKEANRMLSAVDEYYNFVYHEPISFKIRENEFKVLEAYKDKKAMKDKKYKSFYKAYKKNQFISFVKRKFPLLQKIRNRFKNV